MPTHIAFLRAVNVAGRWLTMDRVRTELTAAGFEQVETYIQSGNLLLHSRMRSPDRVAERVASVLGEAAGFGIPTVVRTPRRVADLVRELDGLPPQLPGDTRRYVSFAPSPIAAGARDTLLAWDRPGERATVVGDDHVVIDLTVASHEARLNNARVERIVGQPVTTRDTTVVRTVSERWGQ